MPNSTPPGDARAAAESPLVIEFGNDPHCGWGIPRRWMIWPVVYVLGLLVTQWIMAPKLQRDSVLPGMFFYGIVGAALWLWHHKSWRGDEIPEALRDAAPDSFKDAVSSLMIRHEHVRFLRKLRYLSIVVRTLAEKGITGVTIRSGPPRYRFPLKPLPDPFEPHRLDDLARKLAEEQDPDIAAFRHSTRLHRANERWDWAARVCLVAFGAGWLAMVTFLDPATTGGRVSLVFIPLWTAVLAAGVLVSWLMGWIGTRQWLAVPGGLVLRTWQPFRGGAQLRLFRRNQSFLLIAHCNKGSWHFIVADSHGVEHQRLDPRQAEAALRAWLCPHEPPSEDRMSDWK